MAFRTLAPLAKPLGWAGLRLGCGPAALRRLIPFAFICEKIIFVVYSPLQPQPRIHTWEHNFKESLAPTTHPLIKSRLHPPPHHACANLHHRQGR